MEFEASAMVSLYRNILYEKQRCEVRHSRGFCYYGMFDCINKIDTYNTINLENLETKFVCAF